jgi:hypothetical protein
MTMSIETPALSDLCPEQADEWTPSQEDWEWLWEQTHDDYAENVMW